MTKKKTTPSKKTTAKTPKKVAKPPAKKKPNAKKSKPVDASQALAQLVYQAASDTKALDTVVLDLQEQGSFADYLIVCSGSSDRQVAAIAARIQSTVKEKLKKYPLGVEGLTNSSWVLIDYGDVVCHIFVSESRDFYRLEDLWHAAPRIKFKK